MRNKKLLLYLICTEAMLILCIVLANLNPTPVLYFIFYNFLYGLVFSLLVPLYCLRREKESLTSAGVKRLGTRQFAVLFAFVVYFQLAGSWFPKWLRENKYRGAFCRWALHRLSWPHFLRNSYFEALCRAGPSGSLAVCPRFWFPGQCFPCIILAIQTFALGET